MSDGVWKYAGREKIGQLAAEKQGEELIASIRDSAKMRGSGGLQDDFTLLLFVNDSKD